MHAYLMLDSGNPQQKSRLGLILLRRRVISKAQLDYALSYQRQEGLRFGAAMVELGMV